MNIEHVLVETVDVTFLIIIPVDFLVTSLKLSHITCSKKTDTTSMSRYIDFFFIFLIIILCFFYKPQKINDFLNVTYFKPGGFYFWNKRHNYKKRSTCFSIASYLSKSPISFFSIWEIDKSLEYTFKWL